MISDETAYRRYLDGEQKAADLLVERYGDALTLYINGYIKDIHEAEDLMIEAFSQLFAKERPIEGVGSFKAYLYKTARHLALRHKQKHRLAFLCLDELNFEPRSDSLAETALLRSERDRQLYDALEKLKAEYREALYLVYFEDMSYRDAATVMNKSESQITKLMPCASADFIHVFHQGARSALCAVFDRRYGRLPAQRLCQQLLHGAIRRGRHRCRYRDHARM